MNTCEQCAMKAPDRDWCEYWMKLVHLRGTNRACDMFAPKDKLA